MNPTDAVLAITYRCNAKCRICDIWKSNTNNIDLNPEYYARLPKSLRNINISGGEPFLNPEIVEIIEIINKTCPRARMVISSNGYATSLILRRIKEIQKVYPQIAIRISIDGLGKSHDYMRGEGDFFQRSIETVKKLKELKIADLGISYTASDDNIDQMIDIYKLAVEMDIVYTFCGIAHSSNIDNYFIKENLPIKNLSILETSLNFLLINEIKSWQLKKLARAFYLSGVYDHAAFGQRKIFCGALGVLFFMDPYGNIFSCNTLGVRLFNIMDKQFEEAWFSKEADAIRKEVRKCSHPCWMLCTVAPFIKKKPFFVIKWILFNKMKSLIGLQLKVK